MKKNKPSLNRFKRTLIFCLLGLVLVACSRPEPVSIATVDQNLVTQGYSLVEISAFKAQLEPDQILDISIKPYQVRALQRKLYPYYDDLLELGYTYTEAKALSLIDHRLLIQVMAVGYVDHVLDWIETNHMIPERLLRYQAFALDHPSLSRRAIVERINVNRDYPFYTHTVPVDLTQWPLLVNKYHALSAWYIPSGLVNTKGCGQPTLVKAAADAYDRMCADLEKAGLSLDEATSYRSYAFQKSFYDSYVEDYGIAYTDTVAARPGFSEHQTGYAVDLKSGKASETIFAKTATYRWVLQHFTDYGFILRYPLGKEDITGYRFESWHYTYVGVETAKAVMESGLTLDEYLLLKSLNLLNP